MISVYYFDLADYFNDHHVLHVSIIPRFEWKHLQNRDGINLHCVIKCPNCVVEKTVWRLSNLSKILRDAHLVYELKEAKKLS